MAKTKITSLLFLIFFLGAALTTVSAQNLNEVLKQHMNDTVQQVKAANDADTKRILLNESYEKMLQTVQKVKTDADLTEMQISQLNLLKQTINDRAAQLNGYAGFDQISDEDLDDYSDYSQQMMEQANRTLTISLTTALVILLILILVV